jgi:FMN phosphatase YigB (HAD superfamily)
MSKIIAFDLDDTLCYKDKEFENSGLEKYRHCKPYPKMIEKVNKLFDQGHKIYIYTARGMDTFGGDISKIHENLYSLTLQSLEEWGIKHNGLIMGKLNYDLLIDDKAMSLDEFNGKEVSI